MIARNSSFTYKGKSVDVKQVGRDLGVRYVLEGSVRKAGNRVRVTGQLIDVASGAHIWAEHIPPNAGELCQRLFAAWDSALFAQIFGGYSAPEVSFVRHNMLQ